jgi:CRISPR/Cas system-associated exonuclease Cas4 (RecB family)
MSDKWIRASEISTYLYCRRAWWLRRVQNAAHGHTQRLAAGTVHHQAHAGRVARAERSRRVAYGFLALALVVLAAWLLGGG